MWWSGGGGGGQYLDTTLCSLSLSLWTDCQRKDNNILCLSVRRRKMQYNSTVITANRCCVCQHHQSTLSWRFYSSWLIDCVDIHSMLLLSFLWQSVHGEREREQSVVSKYWPPPPPFIFFTTSLHHNTQIMKRKKKREKWLVVWPYSVLCWSAPPPPPYIDRLIGWWGW